MDFSTGGSIIWIMDLYFGPKQQASKLKCLNDGFVLQTCRFMLNKMLINGLEWCALLVGLL